LKLPGCRLLIPEGVVALVVKNMQKTVAMQAVNPEGIVVWW